MTLAETLRVAVYQYALQGKLTQQLASDSSVDAFLDKVKEKKKLHKNEIKTRQRSQNTSAVSDLFSFSIPKSWRKVKMQDILIIQSGSTKTPSLCPEGIPFVTIQNISKGYLELEDVKYISPRDAEKLRENCFVQKNDILFSAIGECAAPVKVETDNIIAINNLVLFKAVPGAAVNMDYVMILLQCVQKAIKRDSSGTVQQFVTTTYLREYTVPLPPLEEQQRIVTTVSAIIKKVDELGAIEHQILCLNDEFKRDLRTAMLQAAVCGKLSFQHDTDSSVDDLLQRLSEERHRLAKERNERRYYGIAPIAAEDLPHEIPSSWRWIRFGNLVNYELGKTPPRGEAAFWADDFPRVSLADMPDDGVVTATANRVSRYAVRKLYKNKPTPAGTLLMSYKYEVGRVAFLGMDAVHNDAIISIYPMCDNDNTIERYLFNILPLVSQSCKTRKTTKGENTSLGEVTNMLIPLPPIDEQKRIVAALAELRTICDYLD